MRNIIVFTILVLSILLTASLHAQIYPKKQLYSASSPTVLDTMDINNIELQIDNTGGIADQTVAYYPSGSGFSFLYSAGVGLTGIVNGELRTGWSHRNSLIDEFKPGPINASPPDSLDGIYEVTSADTFGSANYIAWERAVQAGADFQDLNGNGVYDPDVDRPDLLGDKTLWTVYNDLTDMAQRTPRLMTSPLSIEIQQTVWGYESTGDDGDILFFRYRVINKGSEPIEDAIITFTADPDIGDFKDDRIACDIGRQMGYTYNFEDDIIYGATPPAFGIVLLQGPIVESIGDIAYRYRGDFFSTETILDSRNQPLQAFATYIGGDALLWSPSTAEIARYYGQGCVNAIGQPVDPTNWGVGGTAQTDCRFFYNGDPVSDTGWLMSYSLDVKVLMSPGQFTLTPGDAQEVIMAYVVAQGGDELVAITEIRQRADLAASIIGFDNTPVWIEPEDVLRISRFQLRQNYPNPFNPSTTIEFSIQHQSRVELTVFNALGQQLQVLQSGNLSSGKYQIPFSADGLEAGVYFYRLKVDGQTSVRKMVYLP